MQPAQNKVFLLSVCPAPPWAHLTPEHSQMLPNCDEQLQPKVSPSLVQAEAEAEQQEPIFSFYHRIMSSAESFKNIPPPCLLLILKQLSEDILVRL